MRDLLILTSDILHKLLAIKSKLLQMVMFSSLHIVTQVCMSTLFVSFLIYPSHFLLKICKVKNARLYAVTMLCQCLNVKLAVVVLWNCIFVASLQINRLSISESSGRYLNFILVSADPQYLFFYANPKIKYFKFIHSFSFP